MSNRTDGWPSESQHAALRGFLDRRPAPRTRYIAPSATPPQRRDFNDATEEHAALCRFLDAGAPTSIRLAKPRTAPKILKR